MTMLLPCTNCRRHVLHTEAECPFCATPLDFSQAPVPALSTRRLGRAATFAFGATMVSATALASCSTDDDEDGGSAGMSTVAGTPNIQPVYGVPADGGKTGTAGSSASGGNGGVVGTGGNAASGGVNVGPVYGVPAPIGGTGGTAGGENAGGADGDGGAGGADSGGLPGPVYGAPP